VTLRIRVLLIFLVMVILLAGVLYVVSPELVPGKLLLVAGANAVLCGLLFLFLDRGLISRLLRLSQEVTRVGRVGNPALRVREEGRDEIGGLGASINAMLSDLEASQKRIAASEEQSRRLADAAHASLSELQGLLNAMPDLYFRMEHNGTILDYHAGQSKDLYVPPETFLKRRMQEVLPPEVGGLFEEGIKRLESGEVIASFEYGLVMGGAESFFEARLAALPNRQIVAMVRNITQRKLSEEALSQKERYLEALVDIQKRLLASHCDAKECLPVLELLGRAARADKVLLLEKKRPAGPYALSSVVEWAPDAPENESLQDASRPWPDEVVTRLQAGQAFTWSESEPSGAEGAYWRERGTRSALILPLVIHGDFWGAIQIESLSNPRGWDRSETALLASASAAISIALERKIVEEALLEGERQFRTLAETATSSILIYQRERILYANPATEVLTGFALEELRTMSFWDFVHPAFRDLVRTRGEARLRGAQVPSHYEFKLLTKDSREQWVDFTAGYTEFRGEPAIVVTLTNVTESKRSSEIQTAAYRISEAVLGTQNLNELYQVIHRIISGLMNAKNFFIALYDAESDWLTFPYFVDEHDQAFPPQKARQGLTEYVLRTGQPLLTDREGIQLLVEAGEVVSRGTPSADWLGVPLKTKDRTIGILAVQSYTEPGQHTERDKNILQFVSTQIALAIERKRGEDELKESERRFRDMLENVQVLAVILDTNGRVAFCNDYFLELTEYDKEDAQGRDWFYSFIPSGLREELRAMFLDNLQRGHMIPHHENEIVTRAGERRLVAWSNSVLWGPKGNIVGTASLGVDITERKHAEQALKESEQRFRTLAETTSAAILIYEGDRYVYVNPAGLAMSGFGPEDVSRLRLWDIVHPEDVPMVMGYFEKRLRGEDAPLRYEFRIVHKDGNPRWVDASATVIQVEGKPLGLMTAFDITERKRAEEELRLQTSYFRQLFENSPEGIVILDNEDRIMDANRAFSRIFGYSLDEMRGRAINELIVPPDLAEEASGLSDKVLRQEVISKETMRKRKDGSLVPVSILGYPVVAGERQRGVYGIYRDVTERKRSENRLEYLAHHDTMTGLPNRLFFYERLRQALSAARGRHMLAVLFIDLDRFKEVNDTLGHDIGDIVLQTVSKRLMQCAREADVVARMGSDEFTFLIPVIETARDVDKIVSRINSTFSRPFTVATHEFHISTSIGIGLYPADGEDADTLMKNADIAMYRAKAQGGNTHEFFAPENRLRKALEMEEFRIYYQPKVDSATERILGVEALIRWQHPELGLVSPARFMEVAEESGLILPIGEWIMQTACAQGSAWHATVAAPIHVAVNLSARQFQQKNLVDVVGRILNDTKFEPKYLELEITESTAMFDLENTAYMLRRFADLGIHIAIDDFGKGYSSLAYLKKFPIQSIKIDASFVRDIVTDADDAAIVKAIITMGHTLKLQVVAEGVETAEQLDFLRERNCDAAQGYFLAKPMPTAEVTAMLQGRHDRGSDAARIAG